jgi:hypothetical protein
VASSGEKAFAFRKTILCFPKPWIIFLVDAFLDTRLVVVTEKNQPISNLPRLVEVVYGCHALAAVEEIKGPKIQGLEKQHRFPQVHILKSRLGPPLTEKSIGGLFRFRSQTAPKQQNDLIFGTYPLGAKTRKEP